MRTHIVKALLQRHSAELQVPENERFLKERLQVPNAWIAEAVATRAANDGDRSRELLALVEAQRWGDSHIGVLRSLPRFFLLDEFDSMSLMLKNIRTNAHTCSEAHAQDGVDVLHDWRYQGHLLRQYKLLLDELEGRTTVRGAHGRARRRSVG